LPPGGSPFHPPAPHDRSVRGGAADHGRRQLFHPLLRIPLPLGTAYLYGSGADLPEEARGVARSRPCHYPYPHIPLHVPWRSATGSCCTDISGSCSRLFRSSRSPTCSCSARSIATPSPA